MSNKRRPQDHRPASVKRDTTPQAFGRDRITFEGYTYSVDFDAINDIEVLEAFQRPAGMFGSELNGAMTALQKALGTAEYEKFKADQRKLHGHCSATALFELFRKVNYGAPGNSTASSDISLDEAKPSNPTSDVSTS